MAKTTKSIDDMIDYVRQLRRHTDGRRALHIRLSSLEKHFREEHYRRFVASNFRTLISNAAATMFALPNADVMLLCKDTAVDVLDAHLNNIRRKYKDSEVVAGINAVQGVSDAFVEWFDLEENYQGFYEYAHQLADQLKEGKDAPKPKSSVETVLPKPTASPPESNSNTAERLKPAARLKMVMVEASNEKTVKDTRDLDIDLLHSIWNALQVADVSSMVRKQRVMAIVGSHPPQPVMVQRRVDNAAVFATLLDADITVSSVWLSGYLEDFFAARMLFLAPGLENDASIASSMKVSVASVCDEIFDKFDQKLGGRQRSSIILEFSILDLLANQTQYQAARTKIDGLGYKAAVSGIDPRILLWMDYSTLPADFLKLNCPAEPAAIWLTSEIEAQIKTAIKKIGRARVVWDKCATKENIEVGQRLGITLFQGDAVDPLSLN
ncbi:MAG: hypothetical protein KUG56_08065 [Kordiimonadaceae bacterium]|nr:hypothetical protein [Kordiimonadaceae bacterium]